MKKHKALHILVATFHATPMQLPACEVYPQGLN